MLNVLWSRCCRFRRFVFGAFVPGRFMVGRSVALLALAPMLACGFGAASLALAQPEQHGSPRGEAKTYAGFDSNLYPGDGQLGELRRSFDYAGYWLSAPPGATATTWAGKRALMEERGFGFLVLFNGRLEKEIAAFRKQQESLPEAAAASSTGGSAGRDLSPLSGRAAKALGAADAKLAVAAARREGFPERTIIFLDQEEGGRLTADQSAYLFAWVDGVRDAGFRAGVYCSAIEVPDGSATISTADYIAGTSAQREPVALWVYNDACPPSPGCVVPERAPEPALSGAASALVWQYAQSPQRKPIAASCPGYSRADNKCYPPAGPGQTQQSSQHSSQPGARSGTQPGPGPFVDLNTSTSPDPSRGRSGR